MTTDKFTVCKKTRKIAANSLYIVLKKVLSSNEPVSEAQFRDKWLQELRKHKDIFPEGWYTPPPHGIGVLFATDRNVERLKFKSLRFEEYWPQNNIYLNKKCGFAMLYCSPVDRKSGIIGDFGMSIYFGKNKNIKEIIKKELNILYSIFNKVSVNMKLLDIHKIAKQEAEKNGFTNEWWISNTDPTGTNYGHTIPGLLPEWNKKEINILNTENFQKIIKLINEGRRFVNAHEEIIIKPGLAFTIEPRALPKNNSKMPTIYFHTIALFKEGGGKELLTDFDEIFKLVGMSYML